MKYLSIKIIATLSLALGITPLAQAQLACGGTVAGRTTVVLQADIGPCDDNAGPIRVHGPATLDLNGHTITCADLDGDDELPDGIVMIGKAAKVRNGRIQGCADGLALMGEGRHQVKNIISQLNTESGFDVRSDRNKVQRSIARRNQREGFRIVKGFDIVTGNALLHNIAENNQQGGFSMLFGVRNKLIANTMTDNNGSGFFVFVGIENQLKNNRVQGNNGGIIVLGLKNRIIRNQVENNRGVGIGLAVDTALGTPTGANLVTRNTALGNSSADLYDDQPDCGTNKWKKNKYGTVDPVACID